MDLPLPALMGHHQIGNAGTAIAAALQLKPLGVTDARHRARACSRRAGRRACSGSTTARCRGCSAPGSELWLDGAHNPAGGRGHRPDAGRAGGARAQAGRPRHRHDGPQGCRRLPCALPRPGAPRRHRAHPGRPEATHDPVALAKVAGRCRACGRCRARRRGRHRRLQKLEGGPLRILICGSLYLAGHVLALQEGVQAQMN